MFTSVSAARVLLSTESLPTMHDAVSRRVAVRFSDGASCALRSASAVDHRGNAYSFAEEAARGATTPQREHIIDAVLLRETNRQMAAQYAASQAAAAAASSGLSAAHVRSVLTDPLLLEPMRGANVPRESFKGFPKATEYARATYNADVASDHRAASAAEQRFAAETAQRQSAMLAQLEDDARAARQSSPRFI
jgi:hypothetical protein